LIAITAPLSLALARWRSDYAKVVKDLQPWFKSKAGPPIFRRDSMADRVPPLFFTM
jgi:hypothetical protein